MESRFTVIRLPESAGRVGGGYSVSGRPPWGRERHADSNVKCTDGQCGYDLRKGTFGEFVYRCHDFPMKASINICHGCKHYQEVK